MRWVLACSLLILAGCPQSPEPAAPPEAPAPQAAPAFDLEQARALIPEAASMPLEVLERVASAATPPRPASFAAHSVTVQFITARRGLRRPGESGFEWLAPGPLSPAKLMELFKRSESEGWASFVQAEDIRALTLVDSEPGTAKGSLAFEVADHWRGELGFAAEHVDGAWRVVELTLPELNVFSRLDAEGTWTRFHTDPVPRASVGVTPVLGRPLYELDGDDFSVADLTGLVDGFPEATETLTRLTVHVPASRAPSLVATEADAAWRGFELPRDRGQGVGTPSIDLNEVRIKLSVVDPSGRPRQGETTVDDWVQLEVGTRVLRSWDELTALLTREAQAYSGGNPQGLPVILDARANVPACYPIAALGYVLSKGWPVTLAAAQRPYDEEPTRPDWTGALRERLQTELAGLPSEGSLPQAGVRIHAAAAAPWGEVGEVLGVCGELRLYRVTFVGKLGEFQVDLAGPSGLAAQRQVQELEYDEAMKREPRIDPDEQVEKPIIILEEEVEVTQDVPKGTDLSNESNKNLDSSSVNDAYGVGGGAAGAYGQRFGKGSLAREGGSAETEAAVTAALGWLENHQSPDGRWDSDGWTGTCPEGSCTGAGTNAGDARHDVGLTSLALLAFLGNGHSHRFGSKKRTVHGGLKWLKRQQKADGSIGFDPSQGESIYDHAMATQALCEAYAISRDFTLKRYAEKAVEFCLAAQNPGLGWKYGIKSGRSDTSVTGWMVLALKSAKAAGLEVPDAAFDGARTWFVRATDSRGSVGYESPGGGSAYFPANDGKFDAVPVMTAVSVNCRVVCGERRSEDGVRKGARLLAASPAEWPVGGSTRKVNFYYWYYGTSAMYQIGGEAWTTWNAAMQKALLPNQRTGGCEAGSWDPVGEWCLAGGRVYATATNALTLEVYYRNERSK